MHIDLKNETRIWAVYFITIFITFFIHELGHCIVAWTHGVAAIPTPAKEYLLEPISPDLQIFVSLGGILGTVFISILLIFFFIFTKHKLKLSLMAAALVTPGIYTLMFILKGRGHDETEFQEAQSALGFSYSGHSADWFFLIFFSCGILAWMLIGKPSLKTTPRILLGFILTIIFIIGLQSINNAIFDPVFLR